MTEKALKFDSIRVNKKESHESRQPIDLDLVNLNSNQIAVSHKFKHSDGGFEYFIGFMKLLNRYVLL